MKNAKVTLESATALPPVKLAISKEISRRLELVKVNRSACSVDTRDQPIPHSSYHTSSEAHLIDKAGTCSPQPELVEWWTLLAARDPLYSKGKFNPELF